MIELSVINIIHIFSCMLMVFFWGLSIERSERTQKTAKALWDFFLVVVWICILIKWGE